MSEFNNSSNENHDDIADNAAFKNFMENYTRTTSCPSIKLKAERKTTTVYNSKLGGTPYLPPNFEYPCNTDKDSGSEPLKLLAQLNFEELPKLNGFPSKGILQFYAACDDLYGANFDDWTEQTSFRVVYHKDIIKEESLLQTYSTDESQNEEYFPFEGEFLLTGELTSSPMSSGDFRFDKTFLDLYKQYIPTAAKNVYDLDEEIAEKVFNDLSQPGHRIGGYPFFTQSDPRYTDEYKNHTILLLQIDSEGSGKDEILWGDCGVANFFIKPEDLEKCNFSNVMYNWDCC